MLINLRNALMTGKKWKNPYITDGLIAMWDGEWNAGGGRHDASATLWKDLSWNNHDMIISAGSFGPKCYTSDAVKDSAKCASRDEIADPYMLELVFNVKSALNSYGKIFMGNKKRTIGLYTDGRVFDGGNQHDGRVDTLGFFQGTAGIKSYSAYKKWEEMYYPSEAYLDGVAQVPGNSKNGWYGYSSLVFGINNYPWTYYGVVDYYNIRLYSRALTAAEIAANYAIDKERFNLP